MAESMRGLKRSHRCTEVSSADIGSTVTVMGWVQRRRNLGNIPPGHCGYPQESGGFVVYSR